MKLILTPNIKDDCYSLVNQFTAIQPNIYAAIYHSYLKNIKNIDCRMINMEADQYSINSVIEFIKTNNIDEVIIVCSGSNPSASTMTMPETFKITARIKTETNAKVILYGGHPSALPELTLSQSGCDNVIVGDGIDCNIDDIPIIDWWEINPNKYRAHNWHCFGRLNKRSPYAVVWTSLGCPFSCSFCCVNNMYKNKPFSARQRNIENVVNEIYVLNRFFNVDNIKIMDELFIYDLERINKFCDLLEQRKLNLNMWCFARVDTVDAKTLKRLKKVGMNWIAYGFESVSQDTLNDVNKKTNISVFQDVVNQTRSAGINIIADVIVGFPNDNYLSIEKTYKFLKDNCFEYINIYPLFNFPGTEAYSSETDWTKYQLFSKSCTPAGTKYLTPHDVVEARNNLFKRYISEPTYINRIRRLFGDDTVSHIQKMAK